MRGYQGSGTHSIELEVVVDLGLGVVAEYRKLSELDDALQHALNYAKRVKCIILPQLKDGKEIIYVPTERALIAGVRGQGRGVI